jgi:hypothetical protein
MTGEDSIDKMVTRKELERHRFTNKIERSLPQYAQSKTCHEGIFMKSSDSINRKNNLTETPIDGKNAENLQS